MRIVQRLLLLAGAALVALPVPAQTYPDRPIKWVSPWPPGGSNDIFSRALAQKLTESMGQPVVVENRPGAAGTVGTAYVAKQPGDGYTVVLGSTPTHAIAPSAYQQLPYEPLRDFVPVTLVAVVPNVLVVHPSLPVKSVAELIAYAKANPGKLNFASAGNGSTQHLSGELFKSMAGVEMVHVPYKGSAPALNDLLAGQVQLAFDNMTALIPHIQSGKLRALGVTPARRSAALPDVPTIAEAGLPGYEATVWFGTFVGAGTPKPIVARLHDETIKALAAPDIRKAMAGFGAEVHGLAPDDFAGYLRQDIAKWQRVVKSANITLQ